MIMAVPAKTNPLIFLKIEQSATAMNIANPAIGKYNQWSYITPAWTKETRKTSTEVVIKNQMTQKLISLTHNIPIIQNPDTCRSRHDLPSM